MRTVAELLRSSGLPQAEARALLAHAVGGSREALIAHPERAIDDAVAGQFVLTTARRRAGEPLAYLIGEREFYGRRFAVGPDVLIPRPETEFLVQLALGRIKDLSTPTILDLGTGCGCIAISLALEAPDAEVVATDISAAALEVARANAKQLGARVDFKQSDWFTAVEGHFDVIVANPPYVRPGDPHLADLHYEPALALIASEEGLSSLRQIISGAPAHLNARGWLLMEHGYDQGAATREMLTRAGFEAPSTVRDTAGIERVTNGRK